MVSPLALGARECQFESGLPDINCGGSLKQNRELCLLSDVGENPKPRSTSGSDQGKMKKGYGALEASVW